MGGMRNLSDIKKAFLPSGGGGLVPSPAVTEMRIVYNLARGFVRKTDAPAERRNTTRASLILCIASLLLFACPVLAGDNGDKPEPVKHKVLKTAEFTNFTINQKWMKPDKYPVIQIVTDKYKLKDKWQNLLCNDPKKVPEVDFKKYRVVIAVSNPRPDSHSKVKLNGLFKMKKGIKVELETSRKEGIGLQILTAPIYWVVTVPKGDEKVYIEEVKAK